MDTRNWRRIVKKLSPIVFFLFCLLANFHLSAQIGGLNVFEFANLPSSSRVTALGGSIITVYDDDVALALHNPAIINDSMHHQLAMNYNFHFSGIRHGNFNYGYSLKKYKIDTHFGIQYINYGEFVSTDVIGNVNGAFKANETAFVFGAAKQLNERFRMGINLKPVFSRFESYNSNGLLGDIGLSYRNVQNRFNASLVLRSFGTQFDKYTDETSSTPFDIQIGISQQLKHLPFRLSIIAHNLQQWGVRYDDPAKREQTNLFGEAIEVNEFSNSVDNFFRHFIFSGEFLLGKRENFRLRFAYNHLRRKELSVENFRSLAGFSMGVGLKIYKFRIDYGLGYFHLAGATNHISISTNLKEYRRKL